MANAFMAGVDRRETFERMSTALDAPCNPDGSTRLTKAAEEGREALVRDLLTRGASVDAPDRFGNTPLLVALCYNRYDIMRILIERGANVNYLKISPEKGDWSLMMMAAQRDDVTAARMLIDAGAKVDGEPVKSKSRRAKKGSRAREPKPRDKEEIMLSPMYDAVENGSPGVARLLIESGAKVNFTFEGGGTPLIVAVATQHLELVELFLAAGADTRASMPDGLTVLHGAMSVYSQFPDGPAKDIVLALLGAGADPNGVSDIVSMHSRLNGTPFQMMLKAMVVKRVKHPWLMRAMLMAGADVFAVDGEKLTPMSYAKEPGFEEICQLIIEFARGNDDVFNPNPGKSFKTYCKSIRRARDENTSALHLPTLAEINEVYCEGFARALLANGAKVNLEHRCVGGHTPLMHAVIHGNHVAARVLIEAGANVHATDDDGKSTLSYAVELFDVEDARIVRMLLDAGADPNAPEDALPPMISCVFGWAGALSEDRPPGMTFAPAPARVDAIRMLVAAGADPDREYHQKIIPGKPAVSARTLAARAGNQDIARALDDAVKLASTPASARAAPDEEVDAPSKNKCAACAKTLAKMLQCQCRTGAYYCGTTCQKAHWPEHKATCRAAREAKKVKA